MTKFLTIVVVLRRVEDLLEYNVDPISDSANLDLAPIWKQKPKLFLQSLYTTVWRFPHHPAPERGNAFGLASIKVRLWKV